MENKKEELKIGDLVRLNPDTTQYRHEISNPWDEYGIVIPGANYYVRWFNGERNSSYRYYGENRLGNDLIRIPYKERCPVVYVDGKVEIHSSYLMNEKILTSHQLTHEKNHKIKTQLKGFFNTFKEKHNYLGRINFVDCYYKNNLKYLLSEIYKEQLSGEFHSSNIRRYTNIGKDFILLDKIEIPYDQSVK